MKNVKSIHIKDKTTIQAINEIAVIEDRRPHDTALRLFRRAALIKLGRLKGKALRKNQKGE